MKKINVLFLQSQEKFYADSMIHVLLMRFLDREQFEIHIACNLEALRTNPDVIENLNSIADLRVYSTDFGPSLYLRPKLKAAWQTVLNSPRVAYRLAKLANYMRQNKIDVVHCTEKPRDAFYGYLLARVTGARCLIHMHVKVENWISPLTRWAMRRADAIVGVSSFVAESNIAMGFPAARTHFVHNGIDISLWDADVKGDRVRQELGIEPDTILLAAIGRLVYYKGQMELLQALEKVHRAHPKVHLLIVGEGDDIPGSYTQRIKAFVQNSVLKNVVTFTGHRPDVREILAACDIFTFPSFEEPFGMVYLEAMLMRKPVVALASGGAREIVEHGKSGLLSAPQDIDQLAANILTLIRDETLRRQLGEHGRRRVEAHFTAQRMARDFELLYQKILNRKICENVVK